MRSGPPSPSTVTPFASGPQAVTLQRVVPDWNATGAFGREGLGDGPAAEPTPGPTTSRQKGAGTVRGTNQTSRSSGFRIQGWSESPAASWRASGSGNAVPGRGAAGESNGTASSGAVNRPYHGTAARAGTPARANAVRRGASATSGGRASVRITAVRHGNWSFERTGSASQTGPAGASSARKATRATAPQTFLRESAEPRSFPATNAAARSAAIGTIGHDTRRPNSGL